jgi:primosomal protein N' (replication factor Y)
MPLIDAIEKRLKADEQVLIFLNRRGFAPVLLCDSCGWQADCPRCDAHLTVHYTPRQHLHCHHCNYQSRLPTECPSCKSVNLIPTGTGTARLEETLVARFPHQPLIRVDRDTTSRVGSWERIYQRANQAGAAILLGTQMLAKGHHFPHVTLVSIVDVDGGFLSVDFRAPERMAQLIMQVAGRAGRGSKAGQVLIQTRYPENPLLLTLIRHGYQAFATQMLAERRSAQLPPYRHAVLIRAESASTAKTEAFLNAAITSLRESIKERALPNHALEIWGPIPAPMEKRAGVFRGHVLIQSGDRRLLHQLIDPWWPALWHAPERRSVRASLDIDPMELS